MKMNLVTKRAIALVFALSLLLGVGMTASFEAQAQDRSWQREQLRRQRQWEREQRRRQRDDRRDDYGRGDYYGRRTSDGYPNLGGGYDLRQTALNSGYNEGIKEGRKDRDRREGFEFRDEEDFRNANSGYSSRFGSRSLYAQYFRLAFQNGYTDGYRGY